MKANKLSVAPEVEHSAQTRRGALRWLLRELFGCVFVAVLLFVSAGRWDWTMGWAVVALYIIWVTATALLIMPKTPELLAERATRRFSDKRWDNVILALFGFTTLAKFIVAGLDVRYGWTAPFPSVVPLIALLLAALGYALVTGSMVANAYFSMINRIQSERGHSVVSSGPYQYLRHPGYVGSIVFDLTTPIALGSWWALIPGIASALLMIVRTALEDRTLHVELAGYADYAKRVRYRLLPGVW